ncbi:MAG: hypothetical protein ACO2PN_27685 [Pyrobaculum sp.]|jgi:hypothetical protein
MEVKVKLGDVCGGVGRWEVCAAEEVRALLRGAGNVVGHAVKRRTGV